MIYHNLKSNKYGDFSDVQDAEFLRNIGLNIARLRKAKGLSQNDLGAIIDMENTNLSAIENGRQNPTALTLKKIADALGCEVKDFL